MLHQRLLLVCHSPSISHLEEFSVEQHYIHIQINSKSILHLGYATATNWVLPCSLYYTNVVCLYIYGKLVVHICHTLKWDNIHD